MLHMEKFGTHLNVTKLHTQLVPCYFLENRSLNDETGYILRDRTTAVCGN